MKIFQQYLNYRHGNFRLATNVTRVKKVTCITKISLFRYFEKRAKHGLPDHDPNRPLSSHVPSTRTRTLPNREVSKLVMIWGLTEYLLSRLQHLKERNVVHTIVEYVAIATQCIMPVTGHE